VPVLLTPDVVLPALRGSYGREYHWAEETATTQRLLPADAAHGALAVARWPELTLVAAHAVADAIGDGATIKHPNDVLVGGRKAAGILAEASARVVLGVGINVGGTAWPGAGWVDRDRLDLLVDVLARLERGYDAWLSR
jgi:biotin-(acetyl-CoA carboxylase) ligase